MDRPQSIGQAHRMLVQRDAEIQRLKAEWDASFQREQDRWHQQERLIQNERESTAEIKRLQAEVKQLNVTLTDVQVENHSLRAGVERLKEELDWTNKGNDEFSHLTGTLAAEVKSLRAELDNQKCDAHHEREQAVALRAEVERLMGDNEHLRTVLDVRNEYIELLKAHGQEEDEDRANDTWRRGQDQ